MRKPYACLLFVSVAALGLATVRVPCYVDAKQSWLAWNRAFRMGPIRVDDPSEGDVAPRERPPAGPQRAALDWTPRSSKSIQYRWVWGLSPSNSATGVAWEPVSVNIPWLGGTLLLLLMGIAAAGFGIRTWAVFRGSDDGRGRRAVPPASRGREANA